MTATATPRPRLPLNTFGIAFGIAGLAGTWSTASRTLGTPEPLADVLWAAAAAAWLLITIRYLRRPGGMRAIVADVRNPVLGPFAALFPAVGSLLAAHAATWSPFGAAVGVWAMASVAAAIGAWFVASLLVQPRDPQTLHGGYLLPTVAGSLVASQSLAAVGQTDAAVGFLAAGVLFWVLIGAVLVGRFLTGPAIPAALVPTLAIFSAPPAVAGNAWWAITGGTGTPVDTVLGALMVALLLPHLFLIRRYAHTGFAIGFWAMTFTAAASATYALKLLSRTAGAWSTSASWAIVLAATALVAVIATRSLGLLLASERWRAPLRPAFARTGLSHRLNIRKRKGRTS